MTNAPSQLRQRGYIARLYSRGTHLRVVGGEALMTRSFKLYRLKDISGVSGIGLICEGVMFSDGHVAIHWLGKYPLTTAHPDGLTSVFAIHDHGGKGDLRLVWDRPETIPVRDAPTGRSSLTN